MIRKLLESLEHKSLEVFLDVNGKICVNYAHSDVKDGYFLIGVCGRGDTLDEAVADYAKQISGKTLVFNSDIADKEERVKVVNLFNTVSGNKVGNVGRWQVTTYSDGNKRVRCTVCKHRVDTYMMTARYCPRCGAHMTDAYDFVTGKTLVQIVDD